MTAECNSSCLAARRGLSAIYFHNEFTNQAGICRLAVSGAAGSAGSSGAGARHLRSGGQYPELSRARRGSELPVPDQPLSSWLRGGWTYTDAVVQQSFASSALQPAINPLFPNIPIGAYSPLVGARPFRIAPNTGYAGVTWSSGQLVCFGHGNFRLPPRRQHLPDRHRFRQHAAAAQSQSRSRLIRRSICTAAISSQKHLTAYTSLQNVLNQKYQEVYGYPALPFHHPGGNEVHLRRRVVEAELKTPTKLNAGDAKASCPAFAASTSDCRRQAQQHLDSLTKPLGSLGQLEAVAAQYVAWREEDAPRIAGQGGLCLRRRSRHHRRGRQRLSARSHAADGAQLPERRRGHQCSGPAYHSDIVVVDVGVDADFEGVAACCIARCAAAPAISPAKRP